MPPFFDPGSTPHGGLDAPATTRNREPILRVLERVLPSSGAVLEISSGTGQHAAFFSSALPGLTWQPTDPDPIHLASIEAWRQVAGGPNQLPAVRLDVHEDRWPVTDAAAVVNINMIHIAPWSACQALMEGAAARLGLGAPLYLYGPFMREGRHTAESNAAFDRRLRVEDPRWGVRDLSDVEREARSVGLRLEEIVEMPANNLSVVFRR
ncbi:MAG: DUF938 domain-containing protein [Myxococcales bacterium]|nr:DUF938 domain-containing protein [Myxococcales bacterium]